MENSRKDIQIDGNIATWELKADGDVSGTYTGIFKFKCYLSPMQILSASKEYREILGEYHLTAPDHEANLAYGLTQLKYRVISAPPFWSSTLQNSTMQGDIADLNIIDLVLDAALASEIKYREELKIKKQKSLDSAKSTAESLLEKET